MLGFLVVIQNAYPLTDGASPPPKVQFGIWKSSFQWEGSEGSCHIDLFHLPLLGAIVHPQLACQTQVAQGPVFNGLAGVRAPLDKRVGRRPALSLGGEVDFSLNTLSVSPFFRWMIGTGPLGDENDSHLSRRSMSRLALLEWWDLSQGAWGLKLTFHLDFAKAQFGFQESLPRILRSLPPLVKTQNAHFAMIFIEFEKEIAHHIEASAGLSLISLELGALSLLLPVPLFNVRIWI